ncbi:muscarinic acetylcholine receptor M5-like [Lytechinus variegatus]|uniref:muscarinic acetylcholine receptor M5-like n=1 Tax=Lytechinus variegatus TaxID=7654 RepID=UPI001BB0F5F5|nr:muscarinic acetylcholine receptor M5-like [Lytechinus variegatus]
MTRQSGPPEPKFDVTFLIMLIISGLTVLTNALILAGFYVQRKLRNYTNYYIMNIAIADLLVGLIIMPLRSLTFLYGTWIFGHTRTVFILGFQNTLLSVSVFGVIAICLDRYIATFYPIEHFQRKSIRKATLVNIGTWVISFAVWFLVFSVWDLVDPNDNLTPSGLFKPNYSLRKPTLILVSFIRALGPFLLICGLYTRIYLRVRSIGKRPISTGLKTNESPNSVALVRQLENADLAYVSSEQDKNKDIEDVFKNPEGKVISLGQAISGMRSIPTDNVADKSTEYSLSNDRSRNYRPSMENASSPPRIIGKSTKTDVASMKGQKVMRTLTLIVLAFVVTWLPNAVDLMVHTASEDYYDIMNELFPFSELFRWVTFCNSLTNPVAYAMAQPLIRQTVLMILRCKR